MYVVNANNAANFFSRLQLALRWDHFKANDSYIQSFNILFMNDI